jgi:hypothetical protein
VPQSVGLPFGVRLLIAIPTVHRQRHGEQKEAPSDDDHARDKHDANHNVDHFFGAFFAPFFFRLV